MISGNNRCKLSAIALLVEKDWARGVDAVRRVVRSRAPRDPTQLGNTQYILDHAYSNIT